jgi:hypothetical protein
MLGTDLNLEWFFHAGQISVTRLKSCIAELQAWPFPTSCNSVSFWEFSAMLDLSQNYELGQIRVNLEML